MKPELPSEIKQHLLDSIQNLKAIKLCLENEKLALQTRDLDQIESLAKQKEHCLEQIKGDIKARNSLISSMGFSIDEAGMESLIASLPEQHANALNKGWQQLVNLHNDIQQLNQANGMVINRGLQQVDMMLGIVQSGSNARTTKTYNAKGRSVATTSRIIGQA
ncbi:FlgN protein [Oceanospirillum multiglobuliferum]|uniref:Flagellar biosynthesis protein FlgN n=1 Tax=Oceanospirillum multiglobuliferum TaxID=64969 RepID=A0A1T4QCZ2_9GAMM|nr:flagellar protein FlgN [Oceanospirillum multiglobuliferum]OPX56530.1 hypothetical protein BTE48_03660 [Oceanospirillum multiglobuliferum]SKA01098.1 FlgN protein [Oceanospirillum multiglobuliferum]